MSRPLNVILWTCHDMGTACAPYGDPSVATPNLSRLAAQGVTFTRQFSTTPLCSPARGAIQTGRYPSRNGLTGLVNRDWDLPAEERCLVHHLAAAGYETTLIGHQHIRRESDSLGFDRVLVGRDELRARRSGELVAERLSAGGDRPFYLEVNCTESHRPWREDDGSVDPGQVVVPPYWPDTAAVRADLAGLYRLVLEIDAGVGTVLDALDSTGRAADTLFVFTVDHGIPFPRCKSTLYDSGIRTALMVRCDGLAPAGARVDDLVSNVDLCPTILDLCGLARPRGLDGRSFRRRLTGESHDPHRQWVFAEKNWHDDYDPMRCVRTERWKYLRNLQPGPLLTLPGDLIPERCPTTRELANRYLANRPAEELYDLHEDPHELHNLAADAILKSTLEDLRGLVDDWMADVGDPFGANGFVPAPAMNWQVSERGRQWWPG